MKNSKYIILYSNSNSDPQLVGFMILDKKKADEYMKCVNLLADNNSEYDVMNESFIFSVDDFIREKITEGEMSTLKKLFDIGGEEEPYGVFPDAVTIAYEEGLTEEDEYEDDDDM